MSWMNDSKTRITPVPSADELVNIVLSDLQTGTPTQIHRGFAIGRIRNMYIRKVRYATTTANERLTRMVEEFPKVDSLHPFYGNLVNLLYDKQEFKIAMGAISRARGFLTTNGNEYVRFLKYADSLYKCKMLKRAALGRMVKYLKKLKTALSYIEEVRQNMSRLPSLNPEGLSIILAGMPNTGKSTFMNKFSNADTKIASYSFTTQNVYVGHFYYANKPWQILDTPGLLNRPLEDRNTIELTAVNALSNVKASVLYLIDMTAEISEQVDLLISIMKYVGRRPVVVCLNKMDVCDLAAVPEETQSELGRLKSALSDVELQFVPTSGLTGENLDDAKKKACDLLIEQKVHAKLSKFPDVDGALERLKIEKPQHRPYGAEAKPEAPMSDRPSFAWLQDQYGGSGVFNFPAELQFDIPNPQEAFDKYPLIVEGENVLDYYQEDANAVLEKVLEEDSVRLAEEKAFEEELLRIEGRKAALEARLQEIKDRHLLGIQMKSVNRSKRRSFVSLADVLIDRKGRNRDLPSEDNYKPTTAGALVRQRRRAGLADTVMPSRARPSGQLPAHKSLPSFAPARAKMVKKAKQDLLKTYAPKGRSSDADRRIVDEMPKHLFSGKMSLGTSRSR